MSHQHSSYEGWRLVPWPTPLEKARSLVLDKLIDDGPLHLYLSGGSAELQSWELVFEHPLAYRNWDESYRSELWKLKNSYPEVGNTFQVENSSWLRELLSDFAFEHFHKGRLHHFVVATEEDVVEVIAEEPPIVVPAASTGPAASG